jgi:hypothetical protein
VTTEERIARLEALLARVRARSNGAAPPEVIVIDLPPLA